MTVARKHPYLRQRDFENPQFLRIRRRVWLILLPYTEGESRKETERLIEAYDSMLDDGSGCTHYEEAASIGCSLAGNPQPARPRGLGGKSHSRRPKP